jgi:tetratricopeptide (TPR) repeat protein
LIREVLLRELPADLRQECHSVVASYLLKGYADRSDYAGPISGHLYRAGRFGEALPYLWRAATEARRLFLYDRALIYLDRALTAHAESGSTDVRGTELKGARAAVLLKLGRPADARQSAQAMLTEASAIAEHPDRSEAEEIVGRPPSRRGITTPPSSISNGHSSTTSATRHPRRAFPAASASWPRSRSGGAISTRRVTHYAAARSRLEDAGDRQGVAEVRMDLGALFARRGEFDAALADLEAALIEFGRSATSTARRGRSPSWPASTAGRDDSRRRSQR